MFEERLEDEEGDGTTFWLPPRVCAESRDEGVLRTEVEGILLLALEMDVSSMASVTVAMVELILHTVFQ